MSLIIQHVNISRTCKRGLDERKKTQLNNIIRYSHDKSVSLPVASFEVRCSKNTQVELVSYPPSACSRYPILDRVSGIVIQYIARHRYSKIYYIEEEDETVKISSLKIPLCAAAGRKPYTQNARI